MKFHQILAFNTILTAIVIGNAFALKKQFYPSVVYITRSKPCIAIIGIQVILCLLLYAKILGKIFFGEVLTTEREQLLEYIWPNLLDTCFAFAVFNRNGNYLFYFRLLCLFFFKTFHFMAQLRASSMGIVVRLPRLFHCRMTGVLLYLGLIDVYQISISLHRIIRTGLSIEVLYLFEYSILLLSIIHVFGVYILECIERMNGENIWDEKVVYSNYLELVFVSSKSVLHLVIIGLLLKMKVLPIFIIRSVATNFRKARNCFWKAVMSRRAIARIHRFPHPKQEDLIDDNMCAICRDEIRDTQTAKKLFCKHMFHIICLKDWFRRQQTCPTCRSDVVNAREPVPQNVRNQIENNHNYNNDRPLGEVQNAN